MKNLKFIVMSLLTSTTVLASDLPKKKVIPALTVTTSQSDWQGSYIGGSLSGGAINSRDNFNTKASGTGISLGIQAGYNWQHGQYVYGIIGDTNISNTRGSSNAFGSTREKFNNSIRGRAGYLVRPDTLLYGTAGLSHSNNVYTYGNVKPSSNTVGYIVGAGLEHKINDKWSIFGEYRYNKSNQASLVNDSWKINTHTNKLTTGLNYKF